MSQSPESESNTYLGFIRTLLLIVELSGEVALYLSRAICLLVFCLTLIIIVRFI